MPKPPLKLNKGVNKIPLFCLNNHHPFLWALWEIHIETFTGTSFFFFFFWFSPSFTHSRSLWFLSVGKYLRATRPHIVCQRHNTTQHNTNTFHSFLSYSFNLCFSLFSLGKCWCFCTGSAIGLLYIYESDRSRRKQGKFNVHTRKLFLYFFSMRVAIKKH